MTLTTRPASQRTMDIIEVSPEMTALIGSGSVGSPTLPDNPIVLSIGFGGRDGPPSLKLDGWPPEVEGDECRLIFLVARDAVARIGGRKLLEAERDAYHLPSELRAIALALRDAPVPAEALSTYRLAKSIELLCEAVRLFDGGHLAPLAGDGALSASDTRRVIEAKRMIDERWSEKLTLDAIARACGLNRAKLTRGFRELFDCTVAEALASRRLNQASRLLLTTDMPVSVVGYEAGYLNNASFARAFGRHFGRSPSDYRACGMAA